MSRRACCTLRSGRLGDDDHRRVQLNAVARDRVLGLGVDAVPVEFALEVRKVNDRGVVDRQSADRLN